MSDAKRNGTPSDACPEKELLVTVLYGEASDAERAALATHLRACASCSADMSALEGARASLSAWSAPELARGFEVVERPLVRRSWWTVVGYAAAASVVLGVSAGVANLDVRYGEDGVRLRTGWSRADVAPAARTNTAPSAAVSSTAAAGTDTPVVAATTGPQGVRQPDDAWRTEMAALETRLRAELGARERVVPTASPAPVPAAAVEGRAATAAVPTDWVRQVQRLIDESEVRQQQNLALRITEVSRDFELQRRADLVQVQQGLGQLGIDATQHKQMWDYFRRVANQEPPR